MSNPSMHTHTPGPWSTRPSCQNRLTIFSEKERRPICTIIHPDRVSDENLQLIKAAPQLAAALATLRREAAFANRHWSDQTDAEIRDRLNDALAVADLALSAAGLPVFKSNQI